MQLLSFHKKLLFFFLQGYCAYTLGKFDRLLVPANPEIGVMRYRDHYYAFSTKEAAYEFAQSPQE